MRRRRFHPGAGPEHRALPSSRDHEVHEQGRLSQPRGASEQLPLTLGLYEQMMLRGIAPKLRVGLVHYKEKGDFGDGDKRGAKVITPLSKNVATARKKLLKLKAKGGGDLPEATQRYARWSSTSWCCRSAGDSRERCGRS